MGVFDEKLHLSDDGLETTLQVRSIPSPSSKICSIVQCNHLSHFLLTNLLRDKLAEAGNARVINVSSFAAWHGKINLDNINYESDSSPAALKYNYHNSKLMNVMFSQEISRRWADLGITAYSNHPGLVRYNNDDYAPKQIKSPQDRGFPALLGGDAEHDLVIRLLDG